MRIHKKNTLIPYYVVASLVGSVLMTNVASPLQAMADTSSSTQSTVYPDEQSLIDNLTTANTALSSAIQSGQISASVFDKLNNSLQAVYSRLTSNKTFHMLSQLEDVLQTTNRLLDSYSPPTVTSDNYNTANPLFESWRIACQTYVSIKFKLYPPSTPPTPTAPSIHLLKPTTEQALIANLETATNAVIAANKDGTITPSMYKSLGNCMNDIVSWAAAGKAFHLIPQLQSVVNAATQLLTTNPGGNEGYFLSWLRATANFQTLQEQMSDLAATPTGKGYHFGTFEVVVDGKPVIAKAQKLFVNNEVYVNLKDAEALVQNITGDRMSNSIQNQNTGAFYNKQKISGKNSSIVWNVGWIHNGAPSAVPGSKGTAAFKINNYTVLHTNVIMAGGKDFVPIWTVQHIIDQTVFTSNKHDVFTGNKWTITFNRNQHYATNGVVGGIPISGSSVPDTTSTSTGNLGGL